MQTPLCLLQLSVLFVLYNIDGLAVGLEDAAVESDEDVDENENGEMENEEHGVGRDDSELAFKQHTGEKYV